MNIAGFKIGGGGGGGGVGDLLSPNYANCPNLLFSKFRGGNSNFFANFHLFCQCRTCYFELIMLLLGFLPIFANAELAILKS